MSKPDPKALGAAYPPVLFTFDAEAAIANFNNWQPPAKLPMTLTVGDPAFLQADVTSALEALRKIIAKYPWQSAAVAGVIIWAVWAANQQQRN